MRECCGTIGQNEVSFVNQVQTFPWNKKIIGFLKMTIKCSIYWSVLVTQNLIKCINYGICVKEKIHFLSPRPLRRSVNRPKKFCSKNAIEGILFTHSSPSCSFKMLQKQLGTNSKLATRKFKLRYQTRANKIQNCSVRTSVSKW